jgi:glutamate transport system substrate-binding protein
MPDTATRWRKALTAVSVSLMLVLVGVAACVKDTVPPKKTVESLRAESPTLKDKTSLRIVVRDAVPLMGYRDPDTGVYSGFEIEIAKAIAGELGFTEDKINWVTTDNLIERQTFLQTGRADMTIASFSITDERERYVNFAGPYLLVPQAVLALRDRKKALDTIADLRAKDVRVCTTTGSTAEKALIAKGITPDPVDRHQQCVEGLKSGKYDAFSTDLTILAGFQSADAEKLEILGMTIADNPERLGIAVPENDTALRDLIAYFLNRWRTQEGNPWLLAYDHTIGGHLAPKYRSQPLVEHAPDLVDYDTKAPKE